MDRILIILKKENGPRASSAPALGLNTIIFKHVYWYMQQTQVSVYRTIGPLVIIFLWKEYPVIKQNILEDAVNDCVYSQFCVYMEGWPNIRPWVIFVDG